LQLRGADVGDLDAIAAIYSYYVENTVITFDLEPPSAADWHAKWDAAQAGGHPWFVAESDGGELLGYVSTSEFRARLAYRSTIETTIYLRDDARSRGIGRPLYELALREAARSFHQRSVGGAARAARVHARGRVRGGRPQVRGVPRRRLVAAAPVAACGCARPLL
jgi:phosphinothricin acetyltransferase